MKIYREVGTLKLITQCDKEGYVRPVYEIEVDEAEPIRHGHWKYRGGNLYECSVCHTGLADDDDILCGVNNYCSYCGAKMDEDDTAPSEEEYDEYYAKHRD